MLGFEQLDVAYSPDVYRFASWLAGNSKDAEDITSETFVRALKKNHIHHPLDESHPGTAPPAQQTLEDQSDLD